MRISLDALLTLDAIDRNGSFAAAAEELHRVPSAVTYTVQKLEQDLDVLIFDRSGHRAKLTPEGVELLAEGRHLLQAAYELESRVQQLAKGWEPELSIAVDEIIEVERVFDLVREFDKEHAPTKLRISTEVLAGTWDALLSGRADLVIGASGDHPPEGGCTLQPLGTKDSVFAVAPNHPLAGEKEPIAVDTIRMHRSIRVADTSRNLPSRTTGAISGQDYLTVPTMRAKIHAQVSGLGVGYVPEHMARPLIDGGYLVEKQVEATKPSTPLFVAWRARNAGKALKWFVARLKDDEVIAALLR